MFDLETYRMANESQLTTPRLIYYPDIIKENTARTIELAGGAQRLWPHVKTHKMAELIGMQRSMGIDRFKCATMSELSLVGSCGAAHALLAYPLIGPNVTNFLLTQQRYPSTHFYALEDSEFGVKALSDACAAAGVKADWLCDVNLGMNRTGVKPDRLVEFCKWAAAQPNIHFVGLHCYDGHNHQTDTAEREAAVEAQLQPVMQAVAELEAAGVSVPIVIAGGSPTFPCHAARPDCFLSPGTVFVWDYGYALNYPDLPFKPGAALLTRVVSWPEEGVFTLDLGYKAIASDPEGVKGRLIGVPNAHPLFQSEEHWTWRMDEGHEAERPQIGQCMYVIPTHICPTTALYDEVGVADGGSELYRWKVAARNRI